MNLLQGKTVLRIFRYRNLNTIKIQQNAPGSAPQERTERGGGGASEPGSRSDREPAPGRFFLPDRND